MEGLKQLTVLQSLTGLRVAACDQLPHRVLTTPDRGELLLTIQVRLVDCFSKVRNCCMHCWSECALLTCTLDALSHVSSKYTVCCHSMMLAFSLTVLYSKLPRPVPLRLPSHCGCVSALSVAAFNHYIICCMVKHELWMCYHQRASLPCSLRCCMLLLARRSASVCICVFMVQPEGVATFGVLKVFSLLGSVAASEATLLWCRC